MAFDPNDIIEENILEENTQGFNPDDIVFEQDEVDIPELSAVERAAASPDSWFTSPTIPQEFSGKRVLESTGYGAGIGAALGAPTGLGVVPGAVAGGFSGLASGIGGEFARMSGAPQSAILATEILSGGLPTLTKNILAKGLTAFPGRSKSLAQLFESPQVEREINTELRTMMFGKPKINVNYTTENTLATQENLRQNFLGETVETLGTTEPTKKVSDILRGRLYDTLKNLKDQSTIVIEETPARFDSLRMQIAPATSKVSKVPNVFINSPEYKQLSSQLIDLRKRNLLTASEFKNLRTTLAEDLSTRPGVAENASQDILNLIQNGGVYTVQKKGGEAITQQKIPEEARKLLKEQFDNYLERTVGGKQYEILKQAEKAEFIAKARDEIPAILETGFKYGSAEMDEVLNSIKNSPEGRKDFSEAVMQHLYNIPDAKKMVSEFNRLRPALIESKVFTPKEVAGIYTKIKSFEPIKDQAVKRKQLQNAIVFPIIGAQSAEMAQPNRAVYAL